MTLSSETKEERKNNCCGETKVVINLPSCCDNRDRAPKEEISCETETTEECCESENDELCCIPNGNHSNISIVVKRCHC